MHDKNSPLTQAIKSNPEKSFDALFTPTSEEPPYPVEGERFGKGMWYEQIFPVMKTGGSHHITQTWINSEGKVARAFSNMFDGITFAPGRTKSTGGDRWGFGSYRYCPWDEVSHFEDGHGNRYEKHE